MNHQFQTTLPLSASYAFPGSCIGLLFLSCLIAAIPGCGGSGSRSKQAIYTVMGSLSINGAPAKGARIILVPETDDVPSPSGLVQEDGTFSLATTAEELSSFETAGDPVGQYSVLVIMPREPNVMHSPDRLGGAYSKPDNPLPKVNLELGENRLEPIRIENAKLSNR